MLAQALIKYKDQDAVIYAIPRGGVAIGAEVANALHLPLDLVLVRKIGHPANPEFAVCAISESGHLMCSEEGAQYANQYWLEKEIEDERREIERRHQLYLDGRNPISAEEKIAVIVDDGIATGMTISAAVHELQNQGARKTVVAVPVAPFEVVEQLKTQADEVITLDAPKNFTGAVGAYYDDFPQISDEDVISFLQPISNQVPNPQ